MNQEGSKRSKVPLGRSLSLNDKFTSKVSLREYMGAPSGRSSTITTNSPNNTREGTGGWVSSVLPGSKTDGVKSTRRRGATVAVDGKKGKLGALSFMLKKRSPSSPRGWEPKGGQKGGSGGEKSNSFPAGAFSIKTPLPPPLIILPPPPEEEAPSHGDIKPIETLFSPRLPPPLSISPPPPPAAIHRPVPLPATQTTLPPPAVRSASPTLSRGDRIVLSPHRATAPASLLPMVPPLSLSVPPNSFSPIKSCDRNNNSSIEANSNKNALGNILASSWLPLSRTTSFSLFTNRRNVDALLDLPVAHGTVEDMVPLPLPPIAKLPPPLAFSCQAAPSVMAEIATPRVTYPLPPSSLPSPRVTSPLSFDDKERRLRKQALLELVNSERDYVQDLDLVINLFFKPLEEEGKPKLKDLNSNLFILANVSRKILKHFDNQEDLENIMVGTVYLSMMQYFRMYNVYCTMHSAAVKTIEKYISEDEDFAKFFNACMLSPQWKGLNIFSYLIKPVQRITKYPLLLKALLMHTPVTHADHAALVKARKEMKEVVRFINEAKRQAEIKQKMVDLWEAIDGVEVLGLCPNSRRLITDVDLRVIIEKGKTRRRKCFLFNDVLLYLKAKKNGRYSNPVQRNLQNLVAIDIWDSGEIANAFMLVDLQTRVKDTLIFPSPALKEEHLHKIRAIVDKEQRKRFRNNTTTQN